MFGKPLRFRAYGTLLLSLVPLGLCGQKLPVRNYTAADGLPHNTVNQIVRDSHGFLWFCTKGGLSRFDGYQFTNYGMADGLPSAWVNALVETRSGQYWIGTSTGLSRFDPKAKAGARFKVYRPDGKGAWRVFALLEDRNGGLWVGAENSLYRFEPPSSTRNAEPGTWHAVELRGSGEDPDVNALVEDRDGSLWVGSDRGLFRRHPDGRIDRFWTDDQDWDSGRARVSAMVLDRRGSLWAGTWGGLWRVLPDSRSISARWILGTTHEVAWSLLESGDGHLWTSIDLHGSNNLCAVDGAVSRAIGCYSRSDGLNGTILALAEDREGNLWLGTDGFGAWRKARDGFLTFPLERATDILESHAGELCAGQRLGVSVLEAGRFTPVRPRFLTPVLRAWGWPQTVLQDRDGDWWLPTAQGLFRFGPAASVRGLSGMAPKAVYTRRDGLSSDEIFRLFEDRVGNIWVSSIGAPNEDGVSWWDRATRKWHHYTSDPASPDAIPIHGVSCFGQDQSGAVWMGCWSGPLARFRDGTFQRFTESDGWVDSPVRAIHEDVAGALWIGSARGLSCLTSPATSHPRFLHFTTADGLSGNDVTSVTSDRSGRIYAATGHGIDRIDVARAGGTIRLGRIRQYTTAEGLVQGVQGAAYRDHAGALWFLSSAGLSKLEPDERLPHPSPALIRAVRIAGAAVPVSELGESAISVAKLKPSQNNVRIEYSGLNFAPGETPRYQYMLEGADSGWGEPTTQVSVSYASMAPGTYRFLVRVADTGGMSDAAVSSVAFTIDPPLWRRWWFLASLAVVIAAAGSALYRLRVGQLLELERVRTRIATDLHDDIGSNLSQIAILSEVALQKDGDSTNHGALARIAEVSRETVQSMSDIVWAVDPGHDHLSDLTNRMRRFANDVFDARNIKLSFLSCGEQQVRVPPDIRREIFLIFKECVNNAARHSGCDTVDVEFTVEDNRLELKLTDNGRGVDASVRPSGHGLASMRRRVQGMGGEIEVASHEPGGVSVHLRVPLPTESYVFK